MTKHDQLKTPAFVLYVAVERPAPYLNLVLHDAMGKPYVPQMGKDQELCQFAIEFPSAHVKKRHIVEAFRNMQFAVEGKLRAAGLLTED